MGRAWISQLVLACNNLNILLNAVNIGRLLDLIVLPQDSIVVEHCDPTISTGIGIEEMWASTQVLSYTASGIFEYCQYENTNHVAKVSTAVSLTRLTFVADVN